MIGEIIGCQPRPTRLTADDHVMPYERGPLFTDHFGRNAQIASFDGRNCIETQR